MTETVFLTYYNAKCKTCTRFADCYPWPIDTVNAEPYLMEMGQVKTEWSRSAGFYREQQLLCSLEGYYTP